MVLRGYEKRWQLWMVPRGHKQRAHPTWLRWRDIKSRFSRRVPMGEPRSIDRANKGERDIGQQRYRKHTLRDDSNQMKMVGCNKTLSEGVNWPHYCGFILRHRAKERLQHVALKNILPCQAFFCSQPY